jgi:hypothetical protein
MAGNLPNVLKRSALPRFATFLALDGNLQPLLTIPYNSRPFAPFFASHQPIDSKGLGFFSSLQLFFLHLLRICPPNYVFDLSNASGWLNAPRLTSGLAHLVLPCT